MKKCALALCIFFVSPAFADTGEFNLDRWYAILNKIQDQAVAEHISAETINAVIQNAAFIPSIVRSDKNQAEFKMTMTDYLRRTVNQARIEAGKKQENKYPTLLRRTQEKYKIQPHVMMAFWGMESDYGNFKHAYKLTDSFLTLIYNGRRETFFTAQLFALMKIADKNNLNISDIRGSWAGAMGHFQFIPTTLQQYGADGNDDGKIDVIDSVSDGMFSAANYLSKLGWNQNEKIVREVILPDNFDSSLCDGNTKKPLREWKNLWDFQSADEKAVPNSEIVTGIVCDSNEFLRYKEEKQKQPVTSEIPSPHGFLTYPNFYRIKRWNNSNWYAVAVAQLADELRK